MPPSLPTILIVDDNPATLYATSRVLRGAEFKVLEATTGEQALQLMNRDVDMVVLDINLPDIDGFEICRRIRARAETARTPVIHLSATFTNDVAKIHGFEAGADEYLTHPVEPPVLVGMVKALLRTRHIEVELRHSEAKFKAVFDHAMNGISLLGHDFAFLDVNSAMCHMLGRSEQQLVGQNVFAFSEDDHRALGREIIHHLSRQTGWRGVFPLRNPDGRLIHLEWNIAQHSIPGTWLAIASDISDRVKAEQEREELLASERAARTEAERANRLKDDFLATLSHELRTPLHAIVGWSQLLKLGGLDEKEAAEGIDAIERNAKIQAQMIADLLDVSRITSGKLRLDMQHVAPEAVIESSISSALPAAEAKGIRFVKQLNPVVGAVLGDPSRLQQVVSNLLSNAVKFTPQGGRIVIRLEQTDANVEISVTDNGQGIASQLLPHVFERFRQGMSPGMGGNGGLGLGLAIAKQLVEMHGGTIRAESAGLEKGSQFIVTLPRSSTHRNNFERPAEAADLAKPRSPAAKEALASLAGVRVLLVDDNDDSRNLTNRILIDSGAEPCTTSGAAEALGIVEAFQPHVLVSDLGMPSQDGFEFIQQLRARGYSHQQLPAIALTAFARTEDRRRALLAGFQMHLSKPVDPAELTLAIASLLGRTDAGKESTGPVRRS